MRSRRHKRPRSLPWPQLLAALLLFHLVLVLPDRVEEVGWPALLRLPIELPLLVALLSLPLGWIGRAFLRVVAALALTLLLVIKLADMGAYMALARPFDLVLDLYLLPAGFRLLSGSIGLWQALLAVAMVVLAVAAAAWLLLLSAGSLGKAASGRRMVLVLGSLMATGLAATGLMNGWPLTTATSSKIVAGQIERAAESATDLAAFKIEEADDPISEVPAGIILDRLRGKDVVIVFVESYGATALTDPLYGDHVLPVLERFEGVLARKGFAARSAFLMSTTMGGESWRAHSSLQAGIRIDNQRRYEALVTGRRGTLIRDAKKAGWETAVVMPAITLPWPEGRYYGYDRIYEAADLGYRGKPFDWMPMPDQYTLAAFERLERSRPGRKPLMAVMALISSHTPWTPIPELVGWDEVGDGTVFDAAADSGDSEAVVWSDPDRIRLQYRLSIEYTLGVLASYVERYGDRNLVMLIVGDHPPLPLVAGETASRAVPIHLLAGDPEILSSISDWGWTPGMRPDTAAPTWSMESMRARFVRAFTAASVPH